MRKMLRLFAALMVTASLAGCAGGQASETPKAAPPEHRRKERAGALKRGSRKKISM